MRPFKERQMPDPVVDLRSDTVTRPGQAMREAMLRAEVGDDVLDHDPTTLALETRVAEILGKEKALFFPSGVQANQTALAVHGRPGTEAICEAGAHIFNYEEAAGSALSGLQLHPVSAPGGLLTPDLVQEAIRPDSPYVPATSLIALENTHNSAGGKILPLDMGLTIRAVAQEAGLPIHLDGARLWHASVATGEPVERLASVGDTVMVCLSKGLGAPVGSLLAGPGEFMERAWRVRRRLGGGMRQSGILAAAGLYALDHHRDRLAEDHRRARTLAEEARKIPGLVVEAPDTNIVMLDLQIPDLGVQEVLSFLAREGVWMVPFGPRRIRAVTHLEVGDVGVERALDALKRAMEKLGR
jgi:threonine aldolase